MNIDNLKLDMLNPKRVFLICGFVLLLLMIETGYLYWQSQLAENEINKIKAELALLQEQTLFLSEKVDNRQVTSSLVVAVNEARGEFNLAQSALDKLHELDIALQQGFSAELLDLSELTPAEISLNAAYLSHDALCIYGTVKKSDALVIWQQNLKHSQRLTSRQLELEKKQENENGRYAFELHTQNLCERKPI